MALSIPVRLANGVGNPPLAENWMDDYDWLTAVAGGLAFIANGGMELWAAGTTFTNPANATVLSDSWTEIKSGTSSCTADVTREASIVDTGTYAMKVNITGAGSSDSYWAITQSNSGFIGFSGLTVLAGAAIRCATANKVRIKITDGVTTAFSSYHTGNGAYQVLQVKLTASATPSAMTITIEINPANFTDAVYIDSAFLYNVPSAISARAQASLVYTPLGSIGSYLPLSGGTMTGTISFDAPGVKGIHGCDGSTSATAGNVGEVIESVSSQTAMPATTVYGDLASIALTKGDWLISAFFRLNANSAPITEWTAGISSTAGNSAAGLVEGSNSVSNVPQAAFSANVRTSVGIPSYHVLIASNTTYNLKYEAIYASGSPFATGRITAVRIR